MIGFVIQTRATDIGKLHLSNIAAPAARIICDGKGTHMKKSPTKNAMEIDLRFMCHRLGSCSKEPKILSDFDCVILCGSGKYLRKNFFGIIHLYNWAV